MCKYIGFLKLTNMRRYDVAVLYLEQAGYNLENAMSAFRADETWERDHPLQISKKGKGPAPQSSGKRRWFGGNGGGITGQL